MERGEKQNQNKRKLKQGKTEIGKNRNWEN